MSQSAHRPLSYRLRAELYMQLGQMEIAGLPFDKAVAVLDIAAPAKARLDAFRKLTARRIDPAQAGENAACSPSSKRD